MDFFEIIEQNKFLQILSIIILMIVALLFKVYVMSILTIWLKKDTNSESIA